MHTTSTADAESTRADGAPAPPPAGASPSAPGPLRVPFTPAETLDRLGAASRRGRLPGYHADGPAAFRLRVFGDPFDRDLLAEVRPEGGGSELRFRLRLLPWMPGLFVAVAVFCVWPGVWFTDSLMQTYFPGFAARVPTWWWYIPLTVVPLPLAARSMWRKSVRTTREETDKAVARLREELGAP